MDVRITSRKISGEVAAISSKSAGHRALIAAALSRNKTVIKINTFSNDIKATAACLKELGAKLDFYSDRIEVEPIDKIPSNPKLNCLESGSTLRFLLPVAAALCDGFEITGEGRLPERPMNELISEMKNHGCFFSDEKLPYKVSGRLTAGKYYLPGDVSSQYITGLLFALPLLKGKSEIILTSALESSSYIEMTLQTLKDFGVFIEKRGNSYIIPQNSEYVSPGEVLIEGDYSNAAFFLAADFICGNVKVSGLSSDSLQGDKVFTDVIRNLKDGAMIDASEIPDIVLPICVCACAIEGIVTIKNAGRLRLKESDRLEAAKNMIISLGGKAKTTLDEIKIYGTGKLLGGVVDGYNDHRVVMSAAIASCICENDVTILGAHAVDKSYPGFFKEFNRLGGKADVINIRK